VSRIRALTSGDCTGHTVPGAQARAPGTRYYLVASKEQTCPDLDGEERGASLLVVVHGMPPHEGKGKAAAAELAGGAPKHKGTSHGTWIRNSQLLVAEGFLPKVLEELGWNVHAVEGAGDCWAIATRAREMLKAEVDIQSLTPSQRSKYVTPVRTDLANFHTIVTKAVPISGTYCCHNCPSQPRTTNVPRMPWFRPHTRPVGGLV
jgi:hypothetical protein